MAIFLHKPILGNFTIVGPLIWCDNPQVRLWMISNINNNDFHHLGKSQICAGADHYFSPSKPHSGKLWGALSLISFVNYFLLFIISIKTTSLSHAITVSGLWSNNLLFIIRPILYLHLGTCFEVLLLLLKGRAFINFHLNQSKGQENCCFYNFINK